MFLLLEENNLCNYYDFDSNPGIKAKGKFVNDRFAYLEDETVISKLIQFRSTDRMNITFSLPQMHCSSCVFLLENLHKIKQGILKSQTNFIRKEIFIIFDPKLISLRQVVELLAFIGYEPSISMNDSSKKRVQTLNKKRIYRIGVAGFCFSNIMMLSFPDYFSGGFIETEGLKSTFIWLSFVLSLPVLLYSAQDFFISAIKGFRHGIVNIDAPIALATLITFSRSYFEIVSHTGTGYLDSGTGIVFFMLVGRWFQDKTYDSISFDRNYKSFFPLGITILQNNTEQSIPVTKLKKGDKIVIRNEEMVPVDALLMEGEARIDYSFVSGENTPVEISVSDMVFAGGKQKGSRLILSVVNEVSQSYITRLWNNNELGQRKNKAESFIHPWARYFTLVLFTVAMLSFAYWSIYDPIKAFPALTTVLIVACPCTLLLSATFTFGNMLRILGSKKFFLKNSNVIESLADIDTVIFDKTGTITIQDNYDIRYEGAALHSTEAEMIKTLAEQSSHPLSRQVNHFLQDYSSINQKISDFFEVKGEGIQGIVSGSKIRMGSQSFIDGSLNDEPLHQGSIIHVEIDGLKKGFFSIGNIYRKGLVEMVTQFKQNALSVIILSGDNENEKNQLRKLLGDDVELQFRQSPQDKLNFIKKLQYDGKKVLMVGDGLNDAGALLQSDAGIAVSDRSAQFTPASDAILNGNVLKHLFQFIQFAKSGKKTITICFIVSILYNLIGISFAIQAKLSPLIAAILMPISSITVVIMTLVLSNIFALKNGLPSIKIDDSH